MPQLKIAIKQHKHREWTLSFLGFIIWGLERSLHSCFDFIIRETFSSQSIIEGSLEVKLPTIWRDEKQSRAEAQRRGRLEERRSEEKE